MKTDPPLILVVAICCCALHGCGVTRALWEETRPDPVLVEGDTREHAVAAARLIQPRDASRAYLAVDVAEDETADAAAPRYAYVLWDRSLADLLLEVDADHLVRLAVVRTTSLSDRETTEHRIVIAHRERGELYDGGLVPVSEASFADARTVDLLAGAEWSLATSDHRWEQPRRSVLTTVGCLVATPLTLAIDVTAVATGTAVTTAVAVAAFPVTIAFLVILFDDDAWKFN